MYIPQSFASPPWAVPCDPTAKMCTVENYLLANICRPIKVWTERHNMGIFRKIQFFINTMYEVCIFFFFFFLCIIVCTEFYEPSDGMYYSVNKDTSLKPPSHTCLVSLTCWRQSKSFSRRTILSKQPMPSSSARLIK